MNLKQHWTKPAPMRRRAMMLVAMLTLTLLATGCATVTKVVEISSDEYVVTLTPGVPFTPPCAGKFVPEARFKAMLDVYVRESFKK